jgi:hypothetical protein
MTQPIVPIAPIEDQVTPVEPTVFDELVTQSNEPPAISVTPSVVATEIQDEATLSSTALALSSTSNLPPPADINPTPLPVEAASTATVPTASEFERLLSNGFSVPHIGEQLAMTVSNFEQNTGHPVLDVAG